MSNPANKTKTQTDAGENKTSLKDLEDISDKKCQTECMKVATFSLCQFPFLIF